LVSHPFAHWAIFSINRGKLQNGQRIIGWFEFAQGIDKFLTNANFAMGQVMLKIKFRNPTKRAIRNFNRFILLGIVSIIFIWVWHLVDKLNGRGLGHILDAATDTDSLVYMAGIVFLVIFRLYPYFMFQDPAMLQNARTLAAPVPARHAYSRREATGFKQSRPYLLIETLVGGVFVLGALDALFYHFYFAAREISRFDKIFAWLVLVGGTSNFLYFFKEIIFPRLPIQMTPDGLTFSEERGWHPERIFIPWSIIKWIRLAEASKARDFPGDIDLGKDFLESFGESLPIRHFGLWLTLDGSYASYEESDLVVTKDHDLIYPIARMEDKAETIVKKVREYWERQQGKRHSEGPPNLPKQP
jgi:hypothetical protein